MICASVYNSQNDISSDDAYISPVIFHFESIEELNDLLDICLLQGKCVVVSTINKSE